MGASSLSRYVITKTSVSPWGRSPMTRMKPTLDKR